MGSLKHLPEAVHNWVRSGIIIFDLTNVVEELVYNSLDAGATKVSVAVSVGTCYVKVEDNGAGISRDGLALLGDRYATSKFDQLANLDAAASGSFGFRGEALSSISDVSLLEIVTKVNGRPNGYRKVMKGSKCLYLGIDDARQDVGTTVIVRDLFYNQPVRRKCIQSSWKKVLHSVKECVLRIALAHSKVFFKVVDAESEDELLCIHPSSSPLPVLNSFGFDVSCSLKKLDVSDGLLKLSGCISTPFDISTVKAFQYVYINSRFICKGPIHKLLNQLAFSWKDDRLTENVKRGSSQTYPAYILNITCPRSLYDLAFEPSRTVVEFKDWDPVLGFIKSAILDFWSSHPSYEFPENYEFARKKRRTQSHRPVPSPKPKKLTGEYEHLSICGQNGYSCPNSYTKALETKEQQNDLEFFNHTDDKFQPCGRSLVQRKGTVNEESSGCWWTPDTCACTSDGNMLKNEPVMLDIRREHVDCILSPIREVDAKMNVGFAEDELSVGWLVTRNSMKEISGDLERPFLQSCSSRRNLLSDSAPFASNKRFEFLEDDFGFQEMQLEQDASADSGEANDKDQRFEPGSLWQYEEAIFGLSPRLMTEHDRHSVSESRDSIKSTSIARLYDTEEIDFATKSIALFEKTSSSNQPFMPEWSPSKSGSLFDSESPVFQHSVGEHAFESCVRSDGSTRYDYLNRREWTNCNFHEDKMQDVSVLENFSSSSCSLVSFNIKPYAGSNGNYREFLQGKNLDDAFPLRCYDKVTCGTGWSSLDSSEKKTCSVLGHFIPLSNYMDHGCSHKDRTKYQEKTYICRKQSRSNSAPPFYRTKKKFLALNDCFTMEQRTLDSGISHDAPMLQETGKLKHSQKSCALHCLDSNPTPCEDRAEVRTISPMYESNDCEKQELNQSVNAYNLDSVPDLMSEDIQDEFFSQLKWQNCARTVNGYKSPNLCDQDSILDISSGILHLTGDLLVPKSITKNCLADAKVLGQVDKKFIPVVAGGTLMVIDQHAADERIRLEELRQKVLSGEMKTITYLDTEQELLLPEVGYQLLHNYAEQIHSWGWICNIHAQGSRTFKKNLNMLHKKPTIVKLLAVPCILGVDLSDVDLLEFLKQLADTDGSSPIPPAVLRVLNSKACRGAIMFGDILLPSECSLLIEELKRTALCFQCAHGRPTTASIVNLEELHKKIAKLESWTSGSNELWHGLRRHAITLERTAERLSAAGFCL